MSLQAQQPARNTLVNNSLVHLISTKAPSLSYNEAKIMILHTKQQIFNPSRKGNKHFQGNNEKENQKQ
jgi:hypothetical protein